MLLMGCDTVLALREATPRAVQQAAIEGDASGGRDAALGDGGGGHDAEVAESCMGEGRVCQADAECCADARVCSPVTHTCARPCNADSECGGGCCVMDPDLAIALCIGHCATGGTGGAGGSAGATASAGGGGSGGATATNACLPAGVRCTTADTCCDGLCVEHGQNAARCEPSCTRSRDCESGCCREFENGRACVSAQRCEADPCTTEGRGYRYWCAGEALTLCYNGMELASQPCGGPCMRSDSTLWDRCPGTDPCRAYPKSGAVCGSTLGADADPRTLYTCQAQQLVEMTVCPTRCSAGDPDSADVCE